ncbi:MAG: YfiR family protein [Acidobacteria bacterium]|nr:YfiR family protein [Acidobacteriota bacterium]MBS1866010.1 YfiR family protein [Acidobacteriota bacterium]
MNPPGGIVSVDSSKFCCILTRVRATAVCISLALATAGVGPQTTAQGSIPNEYVWKANFLARSASFVDWPGESPFQAANSFRWCVFGTFSFGTTLAELTRDVVVNGKKSEVKWIHKEGDLSGCQIIFVSRSEEKHYAKVLDAARAGRGLTVGETQDFLDAGGMMTLLTDGSSPGFEVNLEAVQAARLRVSSRLLALAKRVVNRATAAKE